MEITPEKIAELLAPHIAEMQSKIDEITKLRTMGNKDQKQEQEQLKMSEAVQQWIEDKVGKKPDAKITLEEIDKSNLNWSEAMELWREGKMHGLEGKPLNKYETKLTAPGKLGGKEI